MQNSVINVHFPSIKICLFQGLRNLNNFILPIYDTNEQAVFAKTNIYMLLNHGRKRIK